MIKIVLLPLVVVIVFVGAMMVQDVLRDLKQDIELMSPNQMVRIREKWMLSTIPLFLILVSFVAIRALRMDRSCMDDLEYVQKNGLDAFKQRFGREPCERRK